VRAHGVDPVMPGGARRPAVGGLGHIVTSDAFAREKLTHMRLLGASLHIVRSDSLAERLGPNATVVTIMCDTGMKYLSKLSAT
jgi:cysteine synthase